MDQCTQRVAYQPACGTEGGPFAVIGADHLPKRAALPELNRSLLPLSGQREGSLICHRLQPPAANVARLSPTRRCDLGPKAFGAEQTFELKSLLGIPVFRHMRRQRANDPA